VLEVYNSGGYDSTRKVQYITMTSGAMNMVGMFRPLIRKFFVKDGTEKTAVQWGLESDIPVIGKWI
jgi:hypothetical protein